MTDEIFQLFKIVGIGLALMLPLANPLTSMSLFLALSDQIPHAERARQIRLATIYVMAIMLVAYYAGAWIMHSLGISIPGLRVAGGLIVAFLGFTMLFPTSSVTDIPEMDNSLGGKQATRTPNIAFVPLALPGTAGPGTIAIIISLASKVHGESTIFPMWTLYLAPIIVAGILGLLFWICLTSSAKVLRLIGSGGVEAISRIMGFLLVCMGVQFVIDGVQEVIVSFTR